MRTFDTHQRDLETARYSAERHNPETRQGAMAILGSKEGKANAQRAIRQLAVQAQKPGEGWLPSAALYAPLHNLIALRTIGVVEQAADDRGRAFRYRLTEAGLRQAGLA